MHALGGDDRAELSEILSELTEEVAREPANLIASTALTAAFVLAGRRREVCQEVERSLRLWRSLPAAAPFITLNVAAGLCEAGRVGEAKELLTTLAKRYLDPLENERRVQISAHIAIRFGEIQWFFDQEMISPVLLFLRENELAARWDAQQRSIEAAIGPRVLTVVAEVLTFDDDSRRLVLDYFTDATSYTEIGELQDLIWDTVESVWTSEFERVARRVAFVVHGPEIPLEDIGP